MLTTAFRRTIYFLVNKLRNFLDKDPEFYRYRYPQYRFGTGTYGWFDVLDWDGTSKIEIGSYCSISKNITILLGGEHRTDWVTTYPFPARWAKARDIKGHPKSKGDIIIGNDVWIGYGVLILSGITVGDGAVIGAGSVVTDNVAPYTIVAGNPAKVIRKRFSDDQITRLLDIRWWNWPKVEIENALPMLCSNDLDAFFLYAQNKTSTSRLP